MSLRTMLLAASVLSCLGCGAPQGGTGGPIVVQPDPAAAAQAGGKPDAPVARHIITKASFTAETDDMDQLSRDLSAKISQLEGYIAGFSEQRYAGNRRNSIWTVRVPANQFELFIAWLDDNAAVIGKEISTQDVSDEYVDLTARLENKKHTEQRLAKVLEERTGKLEEILTVEREIDRVREEIERIEGRMRFLSDRVSMCTITLTVATREVFKLAQAPTFFTRVRETWSSSLGELQQFGEALALLVVGLVPWSPLLAGLGYVAYRAVRWARRRWRQMTQSRVFQPPIVQPMQ